MNYRNIFENLKTVRDFKDKTIDSSKLKEILNYANGITTPNASNFKINIIDKKTVQEKLSGLVGYYGKLIEAPDYMIFTGDEKSTLLDAGYYVETIRLKLEDLGLGSCWISIEDNNAVSEKMGLQNVLAMIAFGEIYNGIFKKDIQKKADRNSITDIVFDGEWSKETTWENLNSLGLDEVFYYTRFAPSWGNSQPWKFIINNSKIYLAISNEQNYSLETGIIILYFEKACEAAGLTVKTALLENNNNELNIPENYDLKACFSF